MRKFISGRVQTNHPETFAAGWQGVHFGLKRLSIYIRLVIFRLVIN